jgi:hypothetical protein
MIVAINYIAIKHMHGAYWLKEVTSKKRNDLT